LLVRSHLSFIKSLRSSIGSDYLYYITRKDKIVKKIYEYISDSTDIIIEGFLRFRLKELNGELEDLVDKIVEEYLVEREYNEFIKLLKYFVEIQESRIDTVNVVIDAYGKYCMYDNNHNEITEEFLKDLLSENMGGEVSYDDLFVSSLITAAPRYIIIHNLFNTHNKEIIETIKNVFNERVKICTGCDLCMSKSPVHKL
jgi:putative sporulation protein YtxC